MATVFAATVANRWFVRRRGLVVGLLTAASATGQLIFLPFLGWLAQERGWRYVSLTVAICTLAVVPLVLVFLRNRPEDAGTRAYGASEDDPPAPPRGNPVAIAFRGLAVASGNRNFWLLAATFFICGASTNGLIGTHLIPAGIDHGMAAVTAASLLAVIGIFDVAGTTISGVLTDRVDSRKLLFAYYGLRGLSLLYLPVAFGSPSFALILFIVFYGLDWVATVPPTVAIASQTFGRASGPIVYGWVFTAHQLGAAVVASAAGVIRTVTGGYELAFIGSGLLCLLAAGLCLLMRRAGETESDHAVAARRAVGAAGRGNVGEAGRRAIELPELTELPGYQEKREVRGRSLMTAVPVWAGGIPMPTLTGWEAVVLAMKAEGVPYVFGLPGDPRHLYDALVAIEPDGGPRPIGVRFETSGAGSAVGDLCERFGIPILKTPAGRGSVPETPPHFCGLTGLD